MEENMTVDMWAKAWEEGKTTHISELINVFTKHVDKMLNSRKQVKCSVPLCGNAVEMKWLWDKEMKLSVSNVVRKHLKIFSKKIKSVVV